MDIFLGTLFIIICVLLILVVLLQKGRGGGLGSAFGGAGSSAFGTRTGDVFTWVTIVLTGLFLVTAVVTKFVYTPPASTADAPIFDPPSGSGGDEKMAVTINVPKGTTVHYTLDGSTPTKESDEYGTDAIIVAPGEVLKARSFRPGWNDSEVVEWRHKLPQPAVTTETPEVPETPETPETPEMPEMPEAPAEPETVPVN